MTRAYLIESSTMDSISDRLNIIFHDKFLLSVLHHVNKKIGVNVLCFSMLSNCIKSEIKLKQKDVRSSSLPYILESDLKCIWKYLKTVGNQG